MQYCGLAPILWLALANDDDGEDGKEDDDDDDGDAQWCHPAHTLLEFTPCWNLAGSKHLISGVDAGKIIEAERI